MTRRILLLQPSASRSTPTPLAAALRRLEATRPDVRADLDTRYRGGAYEVAVVETCAGIATDELMALTDPLGAAGIPVVAAIGDDFADLFAAPVVPHGASSLAAAAFLVRRSAGVICQTAGLAASVERLAKSVHVFAPAIGRARISPSRSSVGSSLRIGCVDLSVDLRDLQVVVPALKDLAARHPDIAIEIVTVAPDAAYDLLPSARVVTVQAGLSPDLSAWDIALGPLADTPGRDARSDVRFLEAAAESAAGIFSAAGPYRWLGEAGLALTVGSGVGASGDQAWIDAIEVAIADPERRRLVAEAARGYVLRQRTVEDAAPVLGGILDHILAGVDNAPVAERRTAA